MNQFLTDPSLASLALYYGACFLNFVGALWMAISVVRMRETDPWIFRMPLTVVGMAHALITVSMFKNPEYAPHATSLIWWWAIAMFGLLVLLGAAGKISGGALRASTYVAAVLAVWGAQMVFTEQPSFGELATYYGFFAANLSAATWMIVSPLLSADMRSQKRAVIMGTGAVYATLAVIGLQTMQMILESPY